MTCHIQTSQLGQVRKALPFSRPIKVASLKGIIKLCDLFSFVQYQDGQKRRKPNYSSVDLSEVEWEDKDDIVRVKANTYQCYVEEINNVPFMCAKIVRIIHNPTEPST